MTSAAVSYNPDMNGIEIRFPSCPNDCVLTQLKSAGYRWSPRRKMWYAHQTTAALALASALSSHGAETPEVPAEKAESDAMYDLWDMTETDKMPDLFDRSITVREIAGKIRKHLKTRFPFCVFSVTSSRDRVSVSVKSAPFSRDSEELKTIIAYIGAYANAYNHCYYSGDAYQDIPAEYHFHYSGCETWGMTETEQTDEIKDIAARFAASAEEHAKREEARRAEEAERAHAEYLKELAEYERLRAIRAENSRKIEEGAKVSPCDYWIENALIPADNKLSSVAEYEKCIAEEGGGPNYGLCHITKEIDLSKEIYDLFSDLLLEDFSFVAGTGGTATNDPRVKSWTDYAYMTEDERETVEMYYESCVAVRCDGKIRLIIDAEGYNYCRYVFFFTDDSRVTGGPGDPAGGDSTENTAVETLVKLCDEIIAENHIEDSFDGADSEVFQTILKKAVYNGRVSLEKPVIQAVPAERERLKTVLYALLIKMRGAAEQFSRHHFILGQRLTLVCMGEFGTPYLRRIIFMGWEGQANAVHLTFVKSSSFGEHRTVLTGNFMVYEGWLGDIPDRLLWKTSIRNGMTVKEMTHDAFSKEYFADIAAYYAQQNRHPVISIT